MYARVCVDLLQGQDLRIEGGEHCQAGEELFKVVTVASYHAVLDILKTKILIPNLADN